MSAHLKQTHDRLGGRWTAVSGVPIVTNYGDPAAEYARLRQNAGVVDLSARGRVCVAGADRRRFLHGQVTNDINKLSEGQGTYAAITTAKGKMVADANIYCLENEFFLDLEPGVSAAVSSRLEKYIIADDVRIIDVSAQYGAIGVIGPKAAEVVAAIPLVAGLPSKELSFVQTRNREGGDLYCMRHSHGAALGFDLFAPAADMPGILETLLDHAGRAGGGPIGFEALEILRIEAGIPRFKQDMDETNLAPETGIDARGISYAKGCYIGQEVIMRIRTYGQVAKALRGLRFEGGLPPPHAPLFIGDREVGYVTSAVVSPSHGIIGLGYVRREHNELGTELDVRAVHATLKARIVPLPFTPPQL